MILFRSADDPLPDGWEPGCHWIVEYHAESQDMPMPLGTAYVTAFPRFVVIDFVFVVDRFRRCGIGSKLVRACQHRWPQIHLGRAFNDAGVAFAEAVDPTYQLGS